MILVLGGLMLGLTLALRGSRDPEGIPPFRHAYGMYARQTLDGLRVMLLSYRDLSGSLPGDARSSGGNGNGRIEGGNGETARVMADLAAAGVLREPIFRVRGHPAEVSFRDKDSLAPGSRAGHWAEVPGFNPLEGLSLDRATDDGDGRTGNVLLASEGGETVRLYVRLELE